MQPECNPKAPNVREHLSCGGTQRWAKYAAPVSRAVSFPSRPGTTDFVGGDYVAPVKGPYYFENPTSIIGETYTEVARGTADDVAAALDARTAPHGAGARPPPPSADLGAELSGGYYIQTASFEGNNSMGIFQEEIFGLMVSVAHSSDYAGRDEERQRHALWPRRAGVVPGRQRRRPGRAGHPGQPGLVNNYQRPTPRMRRRLQVRSRPEEPRDAASCFS